jgi:hypothetical protein
MPPFPWYITSLKESGLEAHEDFQGIATTERKLLAEYDL